MKTAAACQCCICILILILQVSYEFQFLRWSLSYTGLTLIYPVLR